MENSENKSLITAGSSNLAKTEKLLSITQKILSEIKPQYESVRIGNQEWMTRNLDVDRFRNGDLIPHINSGEEMKKAGEFKQPAWCYYDNDPEIWEEYGKLYNWYAVNDPRGLAPEGWHVPSDEEWSILVEYLGKNIAGHKLKSIEGWEEWVINGQIQDGNGDNSSGFNALPCGSRVDFGSLVDFGYHAYFWSATDYNNTTSARFRRLHYGHVYVDRANSNKQYGYSVRCVRN